MKATSSVSKELVFSLRKMITPLAKGRSDIDDILQEVLIKVLRKGDAVQPAKFIAWLHQVSRTTAIDFYRKHKPHAALKDNYESEASLNDDDINETPSDLAKCVRPLLKNLEPEDQRILLAVELEGKSQTDVAEDEGLKYSSLKSKVQRARQKLKSEILRCCQVELDSRKRPIEMKSNRKKSCC